MGFHKPVGVTQKDMPHFVAREQRELVAEAIGPFLEEDECYVTHGIYNTKDKFISVTQNQSLGRLIVTNRRLIFWPDHFKQPHLAIDFESIYDWEVARVFNSRGIFFFVENQRYMFGTHKTAAAVIIELLGPDKKRG